MDIDEKLNKSLDELITEAQQKKKNASSQGKGHGGAKGGKGRLSGKSGRGFGGDKMDIDKPSTSLRKAKGNLKAQGGVQKVRPSSDACAPEPAMWWDAYATDRCVFRHFSVLEYVYRLRGAHECTGVGA
jgi:hypothetical protein